MDTIKKNILRTQYPMTNIEGGGRFLWVDIAKCIGIYLMIIGHGPLLEDTFGRIVIYSFHMPLFFFLSGYLYKHTSFRETIKKDWRRLLIPYLYLNTIGLIFWIICHPFEINVECILSRIFAVFLGLGYNTEHFIPVLTPTWFIIALFLIRIVMSIVIKHIFYVIILSIIVSVILTNTYDTLLPIDSAIMALPFFCFGYIAKTYTHYIFNKSNTILIVYMLLSVLLLLIVSNFNGRVDICTAKYGSNILLFYLGGILGTITICIISKIFCQSAKLKKNQHHIINYSSGSLLVVGFNILAISIVTKFFYQFYDYLTPFMGVILGVLIFCIFYPLILLCGKYAPQIIGLKKDAILV